MARKWEPRELRLVSEYLAAKYPRARTFQRMRVGEIHPSLQPESLLEAERRLVGVFRRWADAIVITDSTLVVIEASIYPDLGDISKVKAYARLAPYTPELQEWAHLSVQCEIVTCIRDPFIEQLCKENGIRPIIFRPPWIDAYLEKLGGSKAGPSHTYPVTV